MLDHQNRRPTRALPKPIMPTPIAAAPKSTIMIGMGRCLLAIARCVQCRSMTSLIGGRTAAINGACVLSGLNRRSPHSFVQNRNLVGHKPAASPPIAIAPSSQCLSWVLDLAFAMSVARLLRLRMCCKSRRAGSVELKIETIESVRRFFLNRYGVLAHNLESMFPAEMLKRLLQHIRSETCRESGRGNWQRCARSGHLSRWPAEHDDV